MRAGFARIQVQVGAAERATLLVEWRDYEQEPPNYYLVSMAKVPVAVKQLARSEKKLQAEG